MSIRMLVTAFVILAACIGLTAFTKADTNAVAPDSKLRELLTERRDALRQRLAAIEASYKVGNTEIGLVIAAENDLLDAELEMSNQPADRIAILEKVVSNMKRIEDWTRQRVGDGTALQQDALLAKASRLQAEIALLRERGADQ
ncbi:hypothetical protein [Aporhodopirellula aestuarii]|uniref:Uncharacterized protein n=1 Tax=Aporhodopirellula aestuarii TaxID=2950107 RepID=A0ABT0TXR0_9BACT|nr:hypothetical protein [Aporhodopirellula aestuarii]MCM2369375.1 hypothetical protein [Aporhodopirellula aestuarii]